MTLTTRACRTVLRSVGPLTLSLAALLLTGCPNPNTYGTPRTVAPGKIAMSVAAEWVGWNFTARPPSTDAGDPDAAEPITQAGSIIVPPTYTLRLGVADEVDVGLRAANMSSLGADVKYNFVRGELLDLAIDPGVQWLSLGFNVYHLHLPLLVGFNVSERVTLVLTPGVMYGITSYRIGQDEIDTELARMMSADGWYGRFGVGVNLRITKRFAIHPELTFLRSLREESSSPVSTAMSYMFGVGFNFGNLPQHGLDGG